jgi:hypothetical protein
VEISFHNLHPVQGMLHNIYIVIGAYGALSWIFLKMMKDVSKFYPYFFPKWYLVSYFLPVLFFYLYYDYVMPADNFLGLTWREQEPAELILSMGFFWFVLANRFRQVQDFGLPEPRFLSAVIHRQENGSRGAMPRRFNPAADDN